MDGLMVDSEPLWFEVERDFARAHGGDWTHELAARCPARGRSGECFDLPIAHRSHEKEIVDRFLSRAHTIAIKAGCLELLAAGRGGITMAGASSSVGRLIGGVLEGLALAPSFLAIVSGDDVVNPKP